MSSPKLTTRERILDTTWHLMEKQRGQEVRVEDIAAAAGVSRQAVYLHFGNRTALLIATVRYIDQVLGCDERVLNSLREQSGVSTLEAYVDFWANYIPDIYAMGKALLALQDTDDAAAAAWKDRMDLVRQGFCLVIQRLQRDEVLAPEWTFDEAVDYGSATVSLATWENLTVERGWSQEQYVRWMKYALKKALVRESETHR